MSNRGFFIGGFSNGEGSQSCEKGSVIVQNGNVIINKPLEFYVDDVNDVYAGGNSDDNNAILIYWTENEMYARKVEY